MKEYADKIPQDKKTIIENAVEQLKEAHKKQDLAAIDSAMASLNTAWTAASQDIYNAQQSAGNAGQQGTQQPGGQTQGGDGEQTADMHTESADNVTDVPYEEVK